MTNPTIHAAPPRNRILLLCLVPPVLTALVVAIFGVDVLYWDEWMIWTKLLPPLKDKTLALSHIVAQQNEQRNAAARVFGLLFLPFFKLNRFPEFYTILALNAVSFASLVGLYRRTTAYYRLEDRPWIIVAFSCLIFSLAQWQVFTFGVNTSVVLPIACLCVSLYLLADRRLPAWKFLLLAAIGYIGSFNFANGLFNWFCLIPSLLCVETRRVRKPLVILLWLLVAASAWGLYFYHYTKPGHHPSLLYLFEHPFITIGFLLAYLGAPLADQCLPYPVALVFGLGGLAALAHALVQLRQLPRERLMGLAPWFALLVFACLTAGATCVGRVGFGIQQQALQSRYIAFSTLFWISLLVVATCAERLAPLPSGQRTRRLKMGFIIACAGMFLLTNGLDIIVLRNREIKFTKARRELFRLVDDASLKRIFPDPHYLKSQLHFFFQERLSNFRNFRELGDYRLAQGQGGVIESIEIIPANSPDSPSGVLLRGWAKDPAPGADRPADYLLIANRGKLVYAGVTGDERIGADPASSLRLAGFTLFLPSGFFPERDVMLEAYSLGRDGLTIARLDTVTPAALSLPEPSFPAFIVDKHFFSP